MNSLTASMESKLRQWRLASASGDKPGASGLTNEIYKTLFKNKEDIAFWDERILLGLDQLFKKDSPNQDVYGKDVQELTERLDKIKHINDIFFKIISPDVNLDDSIDAVTDYALLPQIIREKMRLDNILMESKKGNDRAPSIKLQSFIQRIVDISGVEPGIWFAECQFCIEAIKDREEIGVANSLLVNKQTGQGIVLPIKVVVQRGSGKVNRTLPADDTFVTAIERTRLALVGKGLLAQSQDVILTANLTEAKYSGGSIALGAAMAIYSAAGNFYLDPFTAFTGDINISGNNWVIQGVESISQKLRAAAQLGIRRVFLPNQNRADVLPELQDNLEILFVDDITEVLSHFLFSLSSSQSDSVEALKKHIIQVKCKEQGWYLSEPKPIQDAVQLTISPANLQELKINIYKSGGHTPKNHDIPEYQILLDELNRLDTPSVPIQKIQDIIIIKDVNLKKQIYEQLLKLSPTVKNEPYCDYSLSFNAGKEHIVAKQYTSGKLQLQGSAGALYKQVLEVIIPQYNLHHPNALRTEDYLKITDVPTSTKEQEKRQAPDTLSFPYIGTDESGKGDYFGPLVVAAVWVDEDIQKRLELIGVRDSKTLTDLKCRDLATKIRELCRGKYEEVEIPPDKYNELYNQFRREGKNLNNLLAWGHARALESLLTRQPSQIAIADQFGDEKYIKSKLMEKGKTLQLTQTPKAERYMAVAAASILARDRFLNRLQNMTQQSGISLPKGASQAVIDAAKSIVLKGGKEMLHRVAKMHFKTTDLVLTEGGK
jgi:ribonuclease HIII